MNKGESRRIAQRLTGIKMPYTYILKSLNNSKTYIGSTTNLERRIEEHNNGLSTFSKRYRPWTLIYREEYKDIKKARLREKYLKSAAGRRFIKKKNLI